MKEVLGGRVEMLISGSAPIDPDILNFLKICFCSPLVEGYGQTEACAVEFFTKETDIESGTVGGLMSNTECKLIDVPEMNYFTTAKNENGESMPSGEILVRGSSIIPGYYKNDEKTKEAIDEDGWLHSGDIGTIIPPNNALKVIDRAKNIFKLSQGEYVAPEKLEIDYKLSVLIDDIYVHGNSLKATLVAVVNLNMEELGNRLGKTVDENEDISTNSEIKKMVMEELEKVAVLKKLKGFEKIRDVYVEKTIFQNLDLTTPSFKLKRSEAKLYYSKIFDVMYEKLD